MCLFKKQTTTTKQKIKYKNPCQSWELNPGALAPQSDAPHLRHRDIIISSFYYGYRTLYIHTIETFKSGLMRTLTDSHHFYTVRQCSQLKGPYPVNKHEAGTPFPKIFIIFFTIERTNNITCTKAQILILVSRQAFYQRAWLKKSPRHVSTLVARFLACQGRI